jgi:hypothetical protein
MMAVGKHKRRHLFGRMMAARKWNHTRAIWQYVNILGGGLMLTLLGMIATPAGLFLDSLRVPYNKWCSM